MHELSRWPLKDTVSAKKACRGSETEPKELLGGTEEKMMGPRGQINFSFTKRKQKKIEFMARPNNSSVSMDRNKV